jgi:hypothetical protein
MKLAYTRKQEACPVVPVKRCFRFGLPWQASSAPVTALNVLARDRMTRISILSSNEALHQHAMFDFANGIVPASCKVICASSLLVGSASRACWHRRRCSCAHAARLCRTTATRQELSSLSLKGWGAQNNGHHHEQDSDWFGGSDDCDSGFDSGCAGPSRRGFSWCRTIRWPWRQH